MAQVLTVVIQPLNYDHKFAWHGTAEGGDDFIGQSRVTQLIKQGQKPLAAWGAAQRVQRACGWLAGRASAGVCRLLTPWPEAAALALVPWSSEAVMVALRALRVSGRERAAECWGLGAMLVGRGLAAARASCSGCGSAQLC